MNKLFSGVIIYSASHPQLSSGARTIRQVFDGESYRSTAIPAEKARITDITPCHIVLFGAQENRGGLVTGEYRELYRALQGINLASRYAGFFTYDSEVALLGLKEMVRDTNLTLFPTTLVLKNSIGREDSTIKRWVDDIQTTFEGSIHER